MIEKRARDYSTIVQIIVKDDRGIAIAWRLVSCKMTSRIRRKNSINSQSIFCNQSAFCTRSTVCSLHSVLTGLVSLLLVERGSSPDRDSGARNNILAYLGRWLMCWLYVEELPRTTTIIEQWLLYSNWRRKQIWLPMVLMLFGVVRVFFEMNSLRVP